MTSATIPPGAASTTPLAVPGTPAPGAGPPSVLPDPAPGLQGRGWEIAAELYACLSALGTFCGKHPASRPDDGCMWCRAEAICRVYRAVTGMAEGGES